MSRIWRATLVSFLSCQSRGIRGRAVTYTHLNSRLVDCSGEALEGVGQVEIARRVHIGKPPSRPHVDGDGHEINRASTILCGKGDEDEAPESLPGMLYSPRIDEVLVGRMNIIP